MSANERPHKNSGTSFLLDLVALFSIADWSVHGALDISEGR